MRFRTAPTALAAGVLLLGGLLSGCGGDDDSPAASPSASSSADAGSGAGSDTQVSGEAANAPKDAATSDFCSTYAAIVQSGDSDLDSEKAAIAKLNKIGTPKDMPEDARTGYELLVTAISTATSADQLSQLGEDLSQTDTDKLLSFSQYLTTTCAAELGVGESPSAN